MGIPSCPAALPARIALEDGTVDVLKGQLSNIREPLSRSIFLAALFDKAMAGDMPLADYIGHVMRLAEFEQNIRVQQQISSSIVATIHLMQRLRPQTDDALTMLLPKLEIRSFRHAADATAGDLKRIWFNTFIGVVSTETGLATVRALLNGTTEVPGLQISADIRWILLMILSRNGAADIDALLAAESSSDVSVPVFLTATGVGVVWSLVPLYAPQRQTLAIGLMRLPQES